MPILCPLYTQSMLPINDKFIIDGCGCYLQAGGYYAQ